MIRAAIYARYSSDLQREASIEDQVRICRARIGRDGWASTNVYTDHAASGASRLRPGYQKLLEDARNGEFDVIVAEGLDRLSRDQEDVAGLYKLLSFAGVRLLTLAEGEINELHVGLKGTMNALFLKDLAQKTRRGLEGRVRQGHSGGGLCYGYNVVKGMDCNGEPIRGKRRINEAEAVIVRRIFEAYAAGKSPRRIAFGLNADGIPAPGNAAWGASTINGNAVRGTGILNNELYIGRLVWNRLRYVKDPQTGKRISRLNPRSEWITENVPELAIVPNELWDRVKARQEHLARATRPDVRQQPFWERRRPRYLFSGLMKCGLCGGGFSKISANLFGCSTARNKGTCTNRLNVRRDVLEASVLNGLRNHLMNPDLFKEFVAEFHREINKLRMAEAASLEGHRAERTTIERKLRKIVDAITDGVPARTLKDELLALERRSDELDALLANAKEPLPLIHPKLAEVYRRKVAELHTLLDDGQTRDETFEAIRGLVDEVVLVPEGDRLRIDLKGELAAILALATEGKKPAEIGGLSQQVKMVAGRGFDQYHYTGPVSVLV